MQQRVKRTPPAGTGGAYYLRLLDELYRDPKSTTQIPEGKRDPVLYKLGKSHVLAMNMMLKGAKHGA